MMLDQALIERLVDSAGAARWDVPTEQFAGVLEASADRAFAGRAPDARDVARYLEALHLEDLALACACANGHDGAWEHFVREQRPGLYRAADALDASGGARELADALYADLYGLHSADGTRRSLFRYFHGRSSLGTWLRAVLAQRHVDALRLRRRTEPLPDGETSMPTSGFVEPDPDRARLRQALQTALEAAVALLAPRDRLRLRSYYAAGLTLAQIGRLTGEHEATVSRQLKRTRGVLRQSVERLLRDEARLSAPEIARAVELAVEDPDATADLQAILQPGGERKDNWFDRSS